jgi:hypothetical protein
VHWEEAMRHTILILAAMVALPAWATGETVELIPAQHEMSEMLCISMNCVTGRQAKRGVQARVKATKSHGKVEFTVTNARGQLLLTHVATLNHDGELSSTSLVTATTQVMHAIEHPKPIVAKKRFAKKMRRSRLRVLARR